MRLSAEQVRQGILHPEQLVRDAALRYFAESFSTDPEVMPLAIQAIEAHGWEHAFGSPHLLADLVQTDDTLLWAIDQLNRMGHPKTREDHEQCERLSSIIAKADVDLLMRHEERILALEGLGSEERDAIAHRLELLTLDTADCWRKLEAFCEYNKSNDGKVDLPHAMRLAEAIARDEASAERVVSLLSQKIENYEDNPMAWMEILAAHIAGLMRLEAAVPMLIGKLKEDSGDFVNDECVYAFAKIRTDATAEAIAREFPSATRDFRLFAASSLGYFRTDLAVSKCRELLAVEKDGEVRDNLMRGVLASFCEEGIEPARQSTLKGNIEVRRELLAAATLMGVSFPELAQWKEKLRKQEEEAQRRMKQLLSRAQSKAATEPRKAASADAVADAPPTPPIVRKERVGRNDPCPCKSGKKYKKCCGKDE